MKKILRSETKPDAYKMCIRDRFEMESDSKSGNVTVDIGGKAYVDIYRVE